MWKVFQNKKFFSCQYKHPALLSDICFVKEKGRDFYGAYGRTDHGTDRGMEVPLISWRK